MIKPQRLTLYAAPPLAEALIGFEHNRSGRINQIAQDYLSLVSDHCPNLSDSEWEVLTRVLASNPFFKGTPLRLLWALLAESGNEYESLANRIRSMDTASVISLKENLLRKIKKDESINEIVGSRIADETRYGATITREF